MKRKFSGLAVNAPSLTALASETAKCERQETNLETEDETTPTTRSHSPPLPPLRSLRRQNILLAVPPPPPPTQPTVETANRVQRNIDRIHEERELRALIEKWTRAAQCVARALCAGTARPDEGQGPVATIGQVLAHFHIEPALVRYNADDDEFEEESETNGG
jgi:hypothetical protein